MKEGRISSQHAGSMYGVNALDAMLEASDSFIFKKHMYSNVCLITHHSICVCVRVRASERDIQRHCVCSCIHQRVLCRRLSESVV